jgi:hypothetical protein
LIEEAEKNFEHTLLETKNFNFFALPDMIEQQSKQQPAQQKHLQQRNADQNPLFKSSLSVPVSPKPQLKK